MCTHKALHSAPRDEIFFPDDTNWDKNRTAKLIISIIPIPHIHLCKIMMTLTHSERNEKVFRTGKGRPDKKADAWSDRIKRYKDKRSILQLMLWR